MTEQQTQTSDAVHEAVAKYAEQARLAKSIEANRPAYEQRIADAEQAAQTLTADYQQKLAEAKQVIDRARTAHAGQARQYTAASTKAAQWLRMAELLCAELGIQIPPVPPEALPAGDDGQTRPQSLPAGDGHGLKAWQEAPRLDPLTDPLPPGAVPLHGPHQRPLHLLGLPALAQCPHCGDELVAPGGNGEELLHAATGYPQCPPDQAQARVDGLALQQAQNAERGPEDGEVPAEGPFPPGAAQGGQAGD